ncbi:Maf family protein [Conexibacter woesei]|uniref:Maf family protein n=1 Tax=Conexibacter woesei TaxID=191495 RepID=UPI0003F6544F|nr:nucleoside triphosphate pyrophosphatase [Conexibacter woesei]
MSRLVLASGSPQRRAILDDLGLAFEVRVSDVAEEDEGAPRAVASENALRKALAVAEGAGDDALVVGCDTLVATDGVQIWGKPADADHARRTLRHLSGRTHEVVSGLALVQDGAVRTATEITEVTFRDLSDAEIDWYVATGEWQGRAGAYAIQQRGAVLVNRIAGDYLNVVGLPVAALLTLRQDLRSVFARDDR